MSCSLYDPASGVVGGEGRAEERGEREKRKAHQNVLAPRRSTTNRSQIVLPETMGEVILPADRRCPFLSLSFPSAPPPLSLTSMCFPSISKFHRLGFCTDLRPRMSHRNPSQGDSLSKNREEPRGIHRAGAARASPPVRLKRHGPMVPDRDKRGLGPTLGPLQRPYTR